MLKEKIDSLRMKLDMLEKERRDFLDNNKRSPVRWKNAVLKSNYNDPIADLKAEIERLEDKLIWETPITEYDKEYFKKLMYNNSKWCADIRKDLKKDYMKRIPEDLRKEILLKLLDKYTVFYVKANIDKLKHTKKWSIIQDKIFNLVRSFGLSCTFSNFWEQIDKIIDHPNVKEILKIKDGMEKIASEVKSKSSTTEEMEQMYSQLLKNMLKDVYNKITA